MNNSVYEDVKISTYDNKQNFLVEYLKNCVFITKRSQRKISSFPKTVQRRSKVGKFAL